MGIDFLAEPSDPFGNQDVINSKLEVGMFVADMELSKRVLRYARGPQDDLIEWCIGALRLSLDLLLPNGISRSAQIGHYLISRRIELADDDYPV